jgi:hypothetical protein
MLFVMGLAGRHGKEPLSFGIGIDFAWTTQLGLRKPFPIPIGFRWHP